MKILKGIFYILWRAWFYVWVLLTIVFVFPVLLIVTSSDRFYNTFFKIARAWANTILFVMGFTPEVEELQKIEKNKSYMFCPNHTSMIDIMLMLSITKNPFVFVGKKELARLPIFGFFYKRTCILVDRDNAQSRSNVFKEAQKRLSKGLSVCIFPEGLVPSDESVILSEFKNGAFKLAIEHQIPLVPITFYDCKRKFSYTFLSGSPGKLRVKIHPFFTTNNLRLSNALELKEKTFNLLYTDLINDSKKHE